MEGMRWWESDERGAKALWFGPFLSPAVVLASSTGGGSPLHRPISIFITVYSICFGLISANKTDPSVELYHVLNIFLVRFGIICNTYYINFYHFKDHVFQSQFWASKARTFSETFSKNGHSMKPAKISFDHTERVFGSMTHLQPTKTDRN